MQEKEQCVICETETPYFVDTNITERLNYIEGAGQLCDGCHDRLYGGE